MNNVKTPDMDMTQIKTLENDIIQSNQICWCHIGVMVFRQEIRNR